jgi:hypothetical protein
LNRRSGDSRSVGLNTVIALESDSEEGMHTDVRRLMAKVDDLRAEVVALRGHPAETEEQ